MTISTFICNEKHFESPAAEIVGCEHRGLWTDCFASCIQICPKKAKLYRGKIGHFTGGVLHIRTESEM